MPGGAQVCGFTWSDALSPVVTGMLVGIRGDCVMKNQISSYHAHYAKPDARPSAEKDAYLEQSFAFGDVVTWYEPNTIPFW